MDEKVEENRIKECPHCFSEIDARASVCPVCRRDIDTPPTERSGRAEDSDHGEDNGPRIGFIGMLVVVAGLFIALVQMELGLLILIVGAGLLAYALFTGRLPFWG